MKRSRILVQFLALASILGSAASAHALGAVAVVGTARQTRPITDTPRVRIAYSHPSHAQEHYSTWISRTGTGQAGPVYARTLAPYDIDDYDPIYNTLLTYLRARYPSPQWNFARGNRSTTLYLHTGGFIPFDDNTTNPNAAGTPGRGMSFTIDHSRQIGPYLREDFITLERLYSTTPGGGPPPPSALRWQETLGSPFVTSWQGSKYGYNGAVWPDSTAIHPRCGANYGVGGASTQYVVVDDLFPVTHSYDQYGNHSVTIHNGFRMQNVSKWGQYSAWPAFYPNPPRPL